MTNHKKVSVLFSIVLLSFILSLFTFSNSFAGKALQFNGVDKTVVIPESQSLILTNTITVEAWIKPNITSNYGHVIDKSDEATNNYREWGFALDDFGGVDFGIWYPNSANLDAAISHTAISTSVWTHVAGVYDGSSIFVYQNGQLVATAAHSNAIPATGIPVTIGNSASGNRPFKGLIDEVRVWNTAHTQSQIQSTMYCSLNGNESGLVGYWRLDEGAGQMANDASGHGNNGQLGSTATTDNNDPIWVSSDVPITCNLSSGDWPMYKYDSARTGFNPNSTISSQLTTKWTLNITSVGPVIYNGKVYFGASDNKVYALDASNGSVLWNYQTGGNVASSIPAISNGILYIGSEDTKIYALDANTGALIWTRQTGNVVRSQPVVVGNKIFCSSWDGNIYALETGTGNIAWNYNANTKESAPTVAGGVVYEGGNNGVLYALNADTGGLVWSKNLSGAFADAIVVDGKVYVWARGGDTMYSLESSNGNILWSKSLGGTPAVAYGKVYCGASDGKAYARDTGTGNVVWTYQTNAAIGAPCSVANGIVFIGSQDHYIYGLDAQTGSLLWKYQTSGTPYSPAITMDSLYIISLGDQGTLYKFSSITNVIVNQPPSAPTGLIATPGNGQIHLSWSANTESDFAGYNVYRRTSNSSYAKINNNLVGGPIYTDYSVTNGITYYYVVRAMDNGNLESGNSNEVHATPTGLTIAGNALSFDPSNDYVRVPDNSTLTFTSTITVEAWIKPNNIYSPGHVTSKDDNTNRREFELSMEMYTGEIQFVVHTSPTQWDYARGGHLTQGAWQHVAGVYDGSSIYSYINGTLVARVHHTGLIPNTDVALTIGNWFAGDRSFNGVIDDVRVWNKARNQSQIQSTMNCPLQGNESGLVGYWKLDEGAGQMANDASGHGNNGQLGSTTSTDSNDPTWVVSGASFGNCTTNGSNGNVMSFDGSNDIVTVQDSPSLSLGTSFTVECWVNANAISNLHGTAVGKDDPSSYRREFLIGVNNEGTYFQVLSSPNSWGFARAPQFSMNTWHHLAGVYDGQFARLYIDGVFSASTPFSGAVANTNVPLTIGTWYHNSDGLRPWSGMIGDVRIWNKVRSPSQIQSNMYCTLQGNESGLIGYWKLDEGSGQIAYDVSNNGNNGVLGSSTAIESNDPTWVMRDVPYGNCSTVPTPDLPPSAPTGLVAIGGDKQVSLSWHANTEPDLAGYNVYRKIPTSFRRTRAVSDIKLNGSLLHTTVYVDTTVENGTPYYYVVRAVDTVNQESADSNEASATPQGGVIEVGDKNYWLPVNGWNNSLVNITNTGNDDASVKVEIYNQGGTLVISTSLIIVGHSEWNSFEAYANLYNISNPAVVHVQSNVEVIVGASIWYNCPDSIWEFSVEKVEQAALTEYWFVSSKQDKSMLNIANPNSTEAHITVTLYNNDGTVDHTVSLTASGHGYAGTSDLRHQGSSQPTVISVISDQPIVSAVGNYSNNLTNGSGMNVSPNSVR